jgi:hypothetical protein
VLITYPGVGRVSQLDLIAFAFLTYLVGMVPWGNSAGWEPVTYPSVLWNDNYGILKRRVIERVLVTKTSYIGCDAGSQRMAVID